MKANGKGDLHAALRGTAIACVLAALGYLMLRGRDPMQALLFEDQYHVIIGLIVLVVCRAFLLFVAPGWLLYGLLSPKRNGTNR